MQGLGANAEDVHSSNTGRDAGDLRMARGDGWRVRAQTAHSGGDQLTGCWYLGGAGALDADAWELCVGVVAAGRVMCVYLAGSGSLGDGDLANDTGEYLAVVFACALPWLKASLVIRCKVVMVVGIAPYTRTVDPRQSPTHTS